MNESKKALAHALKILSRRDHCESELRRKLSSKGFSPAAIDETVARLTDAGYLNDGRYARQWAESAIRNGRGYGFRLRLDLSRRGVPEEIIADTISGLDLEYDEVATLTELMARKFAGFDPQQADDRQKRRVIGYFQRRGYTLAAIVTVLRDVGGS
jgi:regulatory protein